MCASKASRLLSTLRVSLASSAADLWADLHKVPAMLVPRSVRFGLIVVWKRPLFSFWSYFIGVALPGCLLLSTTHSVDVQPLVLTFGRSVGLLRMPAPLPLPPNALELFMGFQRS